VADYKRSEVVEGLKALGNWDGVAEAINALKQPAESGGFDWNPFNQDDDQLGVVAEIQNNTRLVSNLVFQVVKGVESLASAGGILGTSEEKLEAASNLVANAIKAAMPFYLIFLKPAVQPIVRHFITLIITKLNDKFGHDWLTAMPQESA